LSFVITEYCAIIVISPTVVWRYSQLPVLWHVWGMGCASYMNLPNTKSKQHIFTSVLPSDSWEIYHVMGEHMHIVNLFLNNFMKLVNFLLNFACWMRILDVWIPNNWVFNCAWFKPANYN
jgi:hypothetical protein